MASAVLALWQIGGVVNSSRRLGWQSRPRIGLWTRLEPSRSALAFMQPKCWSSRVWRHRWYGFSVVPSCFFRRTCSNHLGPLAGRGFWHMSWRTCWRDHGYAASS